MTANRTANAYNKLLIYRVVRYGLILLLVVIAILLLTRNKESSVPFDTVAANVRGSITSDQMQESPARYLKKNFGLSPEDYEGVMIYTPGTNMYANEVLLIRLKDTAQAESVEQAIRRRIESQIQIFEGYAPEPTALLQQAIVDVRGNYILYVTDAQANPIDEVFRKSL